MGAGHVRARVTDELRQLDDMIPTVKSEFIDKVENMRTNLSSCIFLKTKVDELFSEIFRCRKFGKIRSTKYELLTFLNSNQKLKRDDNADEN
ncbi:hypothetical protein L484_003204 [Morus notabilis]|uniref:Uncharacterized protein n=1 Tax=Morus notabilis TaxID=981085 RepID=W9RCS8_9ROSA|nr:hypothetical protein L484_003204 [Morus notabilis]